MRSAFTQAGFYPFEGPSTTDLSLIPLSIRYKLDRAEIKLHLSQWQQISLNDRHRFLDTSCGSATEVEAYRALLTEIIERYFSAPPTSHPLSDDAPWANRSRWPQLIVEQCGMQSISLPPVERWQELSDMDRHALFVLGRSKHAQEEFIAAIRLFFGDEKSVNPDPRGNDA
jgi:hypothetical protein